jgi:predicted secreted hydrolase
MDPARRRWMLAAAALPVAAGAVPTPTVRRGRVLAFPRDHGAHPDARIEWWYATGWLGTPAAPTHGFQVTFFRSRTGVTGTSASRFAARQLLFAHAAVTDLAARTHRHADRIARWTGEPAAALARAGLDDTEVRLGDWTIARDADRVRTRVAGDGFALDLTLARTQPVLLQGDAGYSRKGPDEHQASHYYSEPQLAVQGRLALSGREIDVRGSAWLDHEWSDEILHPQAVGWDWIGMNLFDGSALTAFQLRHRDGSALWAGGSWRGAGTAAQAFADDAVQFEAGQRWTSPSSQARYPLQWSVRTPAGRFTVRALLDAQELDSRTSTGTIYWEGLSELLDDGGRRVGLGYLEMTGYAAALRL